MKFALDLSTNNFVELVEKIGDDWKCLVGLHPTEYQLIPECKLEFKISIGAYSATVTKQGEYWYGSYHLADGDIITFQSTDFNKLEDEFKLSVQEYKQ